MTNINVDNAKANKPSLVNIPNDNIEKGKRKQSI